MIPIEIFVINAFDHIKHLYRHSYGIMASLNSTKTPWSQWTMSFRFEFGHF